MEIPHRGEFSPPQLQHLSRVHVPDVLGPNDVQGAALAGDHEAPILPAHDQRTETPRIPNGVEGVSNRDDDGEGSLQIGQGIVDLPVDGLPPGPSDEVDDDLGIRIRLEDGAFLNKAVSDVVGIGKVPIMGNGQISLSVADHDGLGIGQLAASGRGVADMPESCIPWEAFQNLGVEDLRRQAQLLVEAGHTFVNGADSG